MIENLVQLLTRLVYDGWITDAQAAAIMLYWRDRQDAELAALLSMPIEEGIGPRPADDDDAPPWLPLLSLPRSPQARTAVMDAYQDAHAERMAQLTADLEAGRLTVAEWQAGARRANAELLDAARSLGGQMTVATLRRVEEIEREQAAYLQRFADQLAALRLYRAMPAARRDATGPGLAEWTAAYIAHRLASYSGAARGLFFAASEGGAAYGPGWIVRYIARDDDRTCSACYDAQGYYLPGEGPMPGDVCYGGGACRCRREAIYDPARYAALRAGAQ